MEEKERLKKHLEYLCSFDKLTGEPEALQAVAYISDVLKKIRSLLPYRNISCLFK